MADRIVVVGSTHVELTFRVEHLPGMGRTEHEAALFQSIAGKGANTAVAAARLTSKYKTVLMCALGDDPFAPSIVARMDQEHIDTTHLITRSHVPTATAVSITDRDGKSYRAFAPGSADALAADDINKHAGTIRTASLVVVQPEIRPAAAARVLELCEASSTPVLFTFGPSAKTDLDVSGRMTGLVINEEEATRLTNMPVTNITTARPAAQELLRRGPRFIAITLGSGGVYLKSDKSDEHIPAFKVDEVDATGAGDVFCGALAVGLLDTGTLPAAGRFATAAAALCVTKAGALPSIPTRAEVDTFLAKHKATATV